LNTSDYPTLFALTGKENIHIPIVRVVQEALRTERLRLHQVRLHPVPAQRVPQQVRA